MSAKHTPGPWYFQEYDCVPPCYKAAIGARHNTGSHRTSEPEANEGSVR